MAVLSPFQFPNTDQALIGSCQNRHPLQFDHFLVINGSSICDGSSPNKDTNKNVVNVSVEMHLLFCFWQLAQMQKKLFTRFFKNITNGLNFVFEQRKEQHDIFEHG